MGYKRKVDTVKIGWAEDHELHGLEVELKKPSVRDIIDFKKYEKFSETPTEEEIVEFVTDLARFIIKWNMEDDDGLPVEPTVDNLLDESLEFVMDVMTHWVSASTGVSADLGKGSAAGDSALEELMPMETL